MKREQVEGFKERRFIIKGKSRGMTQEAEKWYQLAEFLFPDLKGDGPDSIRARYDPCERHSCRSQQLCLGKPANHRQTTGNPFPPASHLLARPRVWRLSRWKFKTKCEQLLSPDIP